MGVASVSSTAPAGTTQGSLACTLLGMHGVAQALGTWRTTRPATSVTFATGAVRSAGTGSALAPPHHRKRTSSLPLAMRHWASRARWRCSDVAAGTELAPYTMLGACTEQTLGRGRTVLNSSCWRCAATMAARDAARNSSMHSDVASTRRLRCQAGTCKFSQMTSLGSGAGSTDKGWMPLKRRGAGWQAEFMPHRGSVACQRCVLR